MKTSCKVFNLNKVIFSQKKESTLNHWNESFIKESQAVWNISILLPTCCTRVRLGKLHLHVGLNENANSFLATRCAFGAVNIAVCPVTLYTQKNCAHKHCFIRHYTHDEKKETNHRVFVRYGLIVVSEKMSLTKMIGQWNEHWAEVMIMTLTVGVSRWCRGIRSPARPRDFCKVPGCRPSVWRHAPCET